MNAQQSQKLVASLVKVLLGYDGAKVAEQQAKSVTGGIVAKGAEILKQRFPSQPQGEAEAREWFGWQEACRAAYVTARAQDDAAKVRKAFGTAWSRIVAAAGYKAINAKGEVTAQGKGGGKPKTEKPADAKPVPATQRDLIAALFGHCDDRLLDAVLFATQHELLFVEWTAREALALAKPAKPAK